MKINELFFGHIDKHNMNTCLTSVTAGHFQEK